MTKILSSLFGGWHSITYFLLCLLLFLEVIFGKMHCFVFKIVAQIVFLLINRHVYVTSYVTNSILRFNGQTGKKLKPRINYISGLLVCYSCKRIVRMKGLKRNSGLIRLLVVLGEFMDVYAAGGGLQGPSSVR